MLTLNLKNGYLYKTSQRISIEEICKNKKYLVYNLPLVVDTEYINYNKAIKVSDLESRELVTIQIKSIFESTNEAYIGLSESIADKLIEEGVKPIYPILSNEDSPIIDFLKARGYKADLIWLDEGYNKNFRTKCKKENIPVLTLVVYSHFAVAELGFLFPNKDFIYDAIKNKLSGNVIEFKKRLRTGIQTTEGIFKDYINVPAFLVLDNVKFLLRLKIVDTCALHGISSLEGLMTATGLDISDKNLLSKEDKEDIYQVLKNRPKDFDSYARGDLCIYDILERNSQQFSHLSQMLKTIPNTPKLTIGGTVSDLIQSSLLRHFKVKDRQIKVIKEILSYSSSKELKKYITSTKALTGKVFGGRCFNNRPIVSKIKDLLIDIDIASCYGNGIRNQNFYLGIPVIEDFEINLRNNRYKPLKEFLRLRKYNTVNSDLIYGNWFAIVETSENLNYPQDFLASWFDWKIEDLGKNQDDELGLKTGRVKILKHQVINGCITEDFLEWLFNICSPRQKNELLDKLVVKVAMYYPPRSELKNVEELIHVVENWKKQNETDSKIVKDNSSKLTKIFNLPTYHVKVNLGKLMVDDLTNLRNFCKEIYGKSSSLQTMFKLCTNTIYGVLCSQFFDVSNPLVANNITARARALCWYMEKGLNGFQSITDGCVFEPNKVVTPQKNNRIYADRFIDLYSLSKADMSDYRKLVLKPLKGIEKIEVDFDNDELIISENGNKTILNKVEGFRWLELAAMGHLRDLFPNVSVLHKQSTLVKLDKNDDNYHVKFEDVEKYLSKEQILSLEKSEISPLMTFETITGFFVFEIKDWYEGGTFHGTSNYYLHHRDSERAKFKMRSYEKNRHRTLEVIDDELIETIFFNNNPPSREFLVNQLWENDLNNIQRSKVFIKNPILKPNEYRENSEKYDLIGIFPGDCTIRYGLLREFSLSQFCFNTYEQYKAIDKEYLSNKRKFNQSYEGYFTNEDGTINYDEMILTIDKLIRENCLSINKVLDKNRNRVRDLKNDHPQKIVYVNLNSVEPDSKSKTLIDWDEFWENDENKENNESFEDVNLFDDCF